VGSHAFISFDTLDFESCMSTKALYQVCRLSEDDDLEWSGIPRWPNGAFFTRWQWRVLVIIVTEAGVLPIRDIGNGRSR